MYLRRLANYSDDGDDSVDDDDVRRALLRLLPLLKLLHRFLLRLLALDEAEGRHQFGVIGGDLTFAGVLGAPLHAREDIFILRIHRS
jgi:hypothetical protein